MPPLPGQASVLLAALAGVAVVGLAGLNAGAANPVPDPPAPPTPGPTPTVIPPRVQASDTAAATVECKFHQHGDVGLAESGHIVSGGGWWDRGDCPTAQAAVWVRLQARYNGDWWDIVSADTVTLRPGARAEVKFRCHDAGKMLWRSVIDVDLFERPDDADDLVVTLPRSVLCRPDVTTLHR